MVTGRTGSEWIGVELTAGTETVAVVVTAEQVGVGGAGSTQSLPPLKSLEVCA